MEQQEQVHRRCRHPEGITGLCSLVEYQECLYKGLSGSRGAREQSIGKPFFGVEGDDNFIVLGEHLVNGIGVLSGLQNICGLATGISGAASYSAARFDHRQKPCCDSDLTLQSTGVNEELQEGILHCHAF